MMCELIYDRIFAGIQIRNRRNALGFTQEEFSEKLDRALRTVADIERGAVGMSIETLMKVCSVLKATPNDILLPKGDGGKGELHWLLTALENSSEHVRATAIDIVRAYLKSV